jgi:hypothetical protein
LKTENAPTSMGNDGQIGKCQIFSLDELSDPPGKIELPWQLCKRGKRIIKRRWKYIGNFVKELLTLSPEGRKKLETANHAAEILPGEKVRIRSREEIRKTLDRWGKLEGCAFMEEMASYCGTSQRVLRKVEKFLDERDYLIKKCKGIYILDGIICRGTKDFGACDRSCFFFWKEEWLVREDEKA